MNVKEILENIILEITMELEQKKYNANLNYLSGVLHAKNIVKKYLKENVNEK